MPKTIYESPAGLPQSRPQYGLPFRQLPGTTQEEVTPEVRLKQEIKMGKQQIQQRFDAQWQEINRSMNFIGVTKGQRMLRDLHTKAEQEMLVFDQKAQMQMDQLRNIDRLAQQGMVDNADYLKAYVAFGPQVARSMYPKPEKEKESATIMETFGKLDLYSHKLAKDREQFQIVKRPIKKAFQRAGGEYGLVGRIGWPIVGVEKRKEELQVWDPTIPVRIKDPDTDKMVDAMGKFRKANKDEITAYEFILKEEKAVVKRKTELQQLFGVSQRISLTGTSKGGGFNLGIAESISKPVTGVTRQRQPQPSRQPVLSDPLGLR